MAKLLADSKLPEFTYETPYEKGISIANTVKRVDGNTAIVFLRYYGCTLCQYDIHQYAAEYQKIRDTDGQLLVVLQSDPVKLANQMSRSDLPFDIICDPDQKLYKQFDIKPAESKTDMIDAAGMLLLAKIKATTKLTHGEYEGDELQLPAVLIVSPDMTLTYVDYCKTATAVPDAERLANLMK